MADVRRAAALQLPYETTRKTNHNALAGSPFHSHAPDDRRVLLWMAPHLPSMPPSCVPEFPSTCRVVSMKASSARMPTRRGNYTAPVCYISNSSPAPLSQSPCKLTAFLAEAVGSCTAKCIRTVWMGSDLSFCFNDAEWHGDESWAPALKKLVDKAWVGFNKVANDHRGPITLSHMHTT
ncbi:hypothetical protein B0H12DRAFT_1240619 [Mycena haematopus]|nr:hypothetical protein B0H12DRAFT_1240619 [Mycena haematopus]